MRVKAFAAASLLAVLTTAASSYAQTPTQPPPRPPSQPPAPPPLTATPPPLTTAPPLAATPAAPPPQGGVVGGLPQTSAAVPAAGMVRVHFRTLKDRGRARIAVRTVQGTYVSVCASPCTADLPPGAELRVSLGSGEDEDEDSARLMAVPNDLGNEVDIEVKPASKGGLVGGIIMTSIGGLFALIGVVLISVSGSESRTTSKSGLVTGGIVCLVLGAGLGIPGILLISNRSKEPRVKSDPYRNRDRDDRYSREDSDPLAAPVAFTPLRLGFSF
jgi:hypothetical protein